MWATHAQAILVLLTIAGLVVLSLPLLLVIAAASMINWYRYRDGEER